MCEDEQNKLEVFKFKCRSVARVGKRVDWQKFIEATSVSDRTLSFNDPIPTTDAKIAFKIS